MFKSELLNEAVAGWTVSNAVVAQSGTPFTPYSTNDYNNDGDTEGGNSRAIDLPLYTGSQRVYTRSAAHTSFFAQSPLVPGGANAFVSPQTTANPNAEGENGRQNNFRGPGYFSLDTGVSKKFALPAFMGEKSTFALRVQGINVLNHANFKNPSDLSINDGASFGIVAGTFQGRVIQLGGRFDF